MPPFECGTCSAAIHVPYGSARKPWRRRTQQSSAGCPSDVPPPASRPSPRSPQRPPSHLSELLHNCMALRGMAQRAGHNFPLLIILHSFATARGAGEWLSEQDKPTHDPQKFTLLVILHFLTTRHSAGAPPCFETLPTIPTTSPFSFVSTSSQLRGISRRSDPPHVPHNFPLFVRLHVFATVRCSGE